MNAGVSAMRRSKTNSTTFWKIGCPLKNALGSAYTLLSPAGIQFATAPAFGYANAFPLPANCVRVWEIGDGCPPWPWTVESHQGAPAILTDMEAPLDIRYVARIETTGYWSAGFVEGMATVLAAELAPALTNSEGRTRTLQAEAAAVLAEGKRQDGQEGAPEQTPDGAWLDSRL